MNSKAPGALSAVKPSRLLDKSQHLEGSMIQRSLGFGVLLGRLAGLEAQPFRKQLLIRLSGLFFPFQTVQTTAKSGEYFAGKAL